MAGVRDVREESLRQPFTSGDFRRALSAFTTGVTVVTTRGEHELYGMTANSFSSVSLDPPLVLLCVIRGTEGSRHIQVNRIFAVNILGERQEPISRFFASKERPRGLDAFAEIAYRAAATGSPVIEGVAAYLDCRLVAEHEAGDHLIFVGEVLALDVYPDVRPLVFHHGRYCFLRDE